MLMNYLEIVQTFLLHAELHFCVAYSATLNKRRQLQGLTAVMVIIFRPCLHMKGNSMFRQTEIAQYSENRGGNRRLFPQIRKRIEAEPPISATDNGDNSVLYRATTNKVAVIGKITVRARDLSATELANENPGGACKCGHYVNTRVRRGANGPQMAIAQRAARLLAAIVEPRLPSSLVALWTPRTCFVNQSRYFVISSLRIHDSLGAIGMYHMSKDTLITSQRPSTYKIRISGQVFFLRGKD